MKTIKRFTGVKLDFPYYGPLPGGGYEGKTKELDEAVVQCAEWLQKELNVNIMIRFNSDREDGKAFVVDAEPDGIGIGAGIVPEPNECEWNRERWKNYHGKSIYFSVYLGEKYARKCNQGTIPYFCEIAPDFESAKQLFQENLKGGLYS